MRKFETIRDWHLIHQLKCLLEAMESYSEPEEENEELHDKLHDKFPELSEKAIEKAIPLQKLQPKLVQKSVTLQPEVVHKNVL